MIGQTIPHYKILENIGQGCMGVVYVAEDTSLKREVAIKVLPEQFTQDLPVLGSLEAGGRIGYRFSLDLSTMINQGTAVGGSDENNFVSDLTLFAAARLGCPYGSRAHD